MQHFLSYNVEKKSIPHFPQHHGQVLQRLTKNGKRYLNRPFQHLEILMAQSQYKVDVVEGHTFFLIIHHFVSSAVIHCFEHYVDSLVREVLLSRLEFSLFRDHPW